MKHSRPPKPLNLDSLQGIGMDRRSFLLGTTATLAASAVTGIGNPFTFMRVAYAAPAVEPFTFAYISDTHLLNLGMEHRFVKAIRKAVEDVNAMEPQPDFVLFGGDLAQLGQPEELELGVKVMESVKAPIRWMVGEHDWYFDMGKKWRELFGEDSYSFDHKGLHFVVLNSVIVKDYWTPRNMTPMERMKAMAQLDNPQGEAFTVGAEQRAWLEKDLGKVSTDTPVVVFSHSPLYKYYRPWNFWTDDAEEIQATLQRFKTITVIHGHTHQLLSNKIGNITFHGVLSTAWPWPYAPQGLPKLTVQMNRADPFNQFDGCGNGSVNVLASGQVNKVYNLWDRNPRVVTYEELATGKLPPAPVEPSY